MKTGPLEIFNYTGGKLKFLLLLLFRCPVDMLITLTQAVFLQNAFNSVIESDKDNLYSACIYFGISSLLIFLYNGVVWSCYTAFGVHTEGRLRRGMFERVSALPLSRIEESSHGEWITRLNTDAVLATGMFNTPFHMPHAVNATVGLCVSSGILLYMDPLIFGLTILFAVPHILISRLFIAKPMTKLNESSQEAVARNTADLNAFITCAETAVLYDAGDFLMERFEKSSLSIRSANMKMIGRNAIGSGILPVFGMGGYLLLLLVGGMWISEGSLSFGELTAAFQYRGRVLAGVLMLIKCFITIKAGMAGVKRVKETMEIKPEE